MYYSHVDNNTYTHFTLKKHNKVVWERIKLLISPKKSLCYTLINAGTFNNNPPKKTMSLTGCYHVHVEPKDAIVTPYLDPTFFDTI